MKLTPIDIQQQQFRRALRGCDRREVQSFLDLVAEQVCELTGENNDQRNELRQLRRELDDHKSREETLREAMLTAQRAIDEIREQAKKEAELVVAEAEVRADRILHNAHTRVNKLLEEIHQLGRQRTRAIEELRGILSTHIKLLEVHEEQAHEAPSEGTLTVLDRLRAPLPPEAGDLSAANS